MERQIEIMALRVLCLGTPQGPVRKDGKKLLGDYRWSNALHEALWNALQTVPSENPETLRHLLPAKLTRLGFPDFEWEEFFAPHSLSREEALTLLHRLAGDRAR